jgi:hypothetical protein
MKKIQSNSHRKLEADLIEHPPLDTEEKVSPIRKKKKKKIYQLNQWVDDVSINDVVE